MSKKTDCISYLKVYYGIPPYDKHLSVGSGTFYQWTLKKFGRELVEQCEKELKVGNHS